jgi:hypothetical protein
VRALNQTLPRRSASLSQCCACRRVGSPPQKATNFASRTLTHSPPATLVAGWNPTRAPPPPPPPPPPPTEDIVEADAPVRLASVPTSWYIDPYKQSLRTLVRPCTATTRRKELTIKVPMPREAFEEIMAPLQEGDAQGVLRDDSGRLKPTKMSGAPGGPLSRALQAPTCG